MKSTLKKYLITGKFCDINFNDCENNPCEYSGQCYDGLNGYLCDCPPGRAGKHCTRIQTCPDGIKEDYFISVEYCISEIVESAFYSA